MLRQTGLALGVAILVAVLGAATHGTAQLDAFRHGWWVTAAIAFAGIIPALMLMRQRTPARRPSRARSATAAAGRRHRFARLGR